MASASSAGRTCGERDAGLPLTSLTLQPRQPRPTPTKGRFVPNATCASSLGPTLDLPYRSLCALQVERHGAARRGAAAPRRDDSALLWPRPRTAYRARLRTVSARGERLECIWHSLLARNYVAVHPGQLGERRRRCDNQRLGGLGFPGLLPRRRAAPVAWGGEDQGRRARHRLRLRPAARGQPPKRVQPVRERNGFTGPDAALLVLEQLVSIAANADRSGHNDATRCARGRHGPHPRWKLPLCISWGRS
mmetsp:Transcript_46293/g.128696  ORF Transcript_46293/g.128696 Transcript_46293/m.128696 type:complete len:249 (-) Transcript_46293:837-1583(-)